MEQITTADLKFIQDLSVRKYSNNTLLSNATKEEKEHFIHIKKKLKALALLFKEKYNQLYGDFTPVVSSGNPLTRGGQLNYLWSAFFKGATNKQYAAQISFVINTKDTKKPCLDVGFYFGGASAHSLPSEQKEELEHNLQLLGKNLANAITHNASVKLHYEALIDYGFYFYSQGERVNEKVWVQRIQNNPKNSQIIAKIYPNDWGYIEISTIDAYVAQVVFLMNCIRNSPRDIILPPQTPEQREKQAERLAQIGLKGELFILQQEKEKLEKQNLPFNNKYPRHVALESDCFGYDILSLDEQGKEVFIEVKTTTRKKDDPEARCFFLSSHEFEIYKKNKTQYKLYRVYDIENSNSPCYEELNIEEMKLTPEGYIMRY